MIFTQEQIREIAKRLAILGVKDTSMPSIDLEENPLNGLEDLTIVKDGENIKISLNDLYSFLRQYKEFSEIHNGEFDADNITTEGWYTSITSGKPKESESDEDYLLYMSTDGEQICFSKKNGGKVYHRPNKDSAWITVSHDDYVLNQIASSALGNYVRVNMVPVSNIVNSTHVEAELAACYAGEELQHPDCDMTVRVSLWPNDIIKVRCLYRCGNLAQSIEEYSQDSNAYLYVQGDGIPVSDTIKIRPMAEIKSFFVPDEYERLSPITPFLRTISVIFNGFPRVCEHYIKCNAIEAGDYDLHIKGNFGIADSLVLVDEIEIYRQVQGVNKIQMNGGIYSPDDTGKVNLGNVITAHQDISGKADVNTVPNDVSRSSIDATFVHKDSNNNTTSLFTLREATNQLAGLLTAENKQKLDNLDNIYVNKNLVPSEASQNNKLADKNFVNSSIATATAYYRGNYNVVTDLHLTIDASEEEIKTALRSVVSLKYNVDLNDYCYVQIPTSNDTPTIIDHIDRYKVYMLSGTLALWMYEYTLNNSGFTASQWSSINSGVTDAHVHKLDGMRTGPEQDEMIASIWNTLNSKYTKPDSGIPSSDLSSAVQSSLTKANESASEQALQDAIDNIHEEYGDPNRLNQLEGWGNIADEATLRSRLSDENNLSKEHTQRISFNVGGKTGVAIVNYIGVAGNDKYYEMYFIREGAYFREWTVGQSSSDGWTYVSPYQSQLMINDIGREMSEKGVNAMPSAVDYDYFTSALDFENACAQYDGHYAWLVAIHSSGNYYFLMFHIRDNDVTIDGVTHRKYTQYYFLKGNLYVRNVDSVNGPTAWHQVTLDGWRLRTTNNSGGQKELQLYNGNYLSGSVLVSDLTADVTTALSAAVARIATLETKTATLESKVATLEAKMVQVDTILQDLIVSDSNTNNTNNDNNN